ncbi:MAG: hypothetical protein ACPG42_09205 [Alphaproteobacteria bacterium]
MIVKLTQDLSRGFAPWRDMALANQEKMKAYGMKMIYAGTEKDNDNKLLVLIDFAGPESIESFRNDAELTQARIDAGALVETTVMTPMTADVLTGLPK